MSFEQPNLDKTLSQQPALVTLTDSLTKVAQQLKELHKSNNQERLSNTALCTATTKTIQTTPFAESTAEIIVLSEILSLLPDLEVEDTNIIFSFAENLFSKILNSCANRNDLSAQDLLTIISNLSMVLDIQAIHDAIFDFDKHFNNLITLMHKVITSLNHYPENLSIQKIQALMSLASVTAINKKIGVSDIIKSHIEELCALFNKDPSLRDNQREEIQELLAFVQYIFDSNTFRTTFGYALPPSSDSTLGIFFKANAYLEKYFPIKDYNTLHKEAISAITSAFSPEEFEVLYQETLPVDLPSAIFLSKDRTKKIILIVQDVRNVQGCSKNDRLLQRWNKEILDKRGYTVVEINITHKLYPNWKEDLINKLRKIKISFTAEVSSTNIFSTPQDLLQQITSHNKTPKEFLELIRTIIPSLRTCLPQDINLNNQFIELAIRFFTNLNAEKEQPSNANLWLFAPIDLDVDRKNIERLYRQIAKCYSLHGYLNTLIIPEQLQALSIPWIQDAFIHQYKIKKHPIIANIKEIIRANYNYPAKTAPLFWSLVGFCGDKEDIDTDMNKEILKWYNTPNLSGDF